MIKPARTNPADKLVALLQQAIALHNVQKLDEADAIYQNVLRQAPRHADALHLRALVFHAKNRFVDAARFAEEAIAVAPQVANFHNTAGEAWRRHGRLDLAQKYLLQAIRLAPAMAMAHLNLSLVLSSGGRHKEALACAVRALELNPAYVEAMAQALSIHCALDDDAAALSCAQRLGGYQGNRLATEALGLYHNHLARTHRGHQRWDEAADEIAKALALYPDFWGNWALRAEMSNDAHDFSNAELYCSIAANLAPDNEDARLNIGHVLLEQKRLEEAQSHYAAWLDAHPESDAARFGLASLNLIQGNFEAGWRYYESRWGLKRHGGGVRSTAAPMWDGSACGHLLLYAEQGLGDTIQMLRFLPEVVRRSAGAITLQVPAPLHRIAQRALGASAVTVVTDLPPGAVFDRTCPLMSLPHVLQAHTVSDLGIPAPYIVADSQRQSFFKTMLSDLKGKKIGIVWQGGAAGPTNRRRQFMLDALAPLLAIPELSLVSLQFGVVEPMIRSSPIRSLADHIEDFDDLAAAMTALDAVISVDTGPAHLAGALGLPTYTIIPWLHDWRWGMDGETTYWYPAMVLVRQSNPKEWTSAVEKLTSIFNPQSQKPAGKGETFALPNADQRAIRKNLFPFVHINCREGIIAAPLFDPVITRSLLAYGEYLQPECELVSSYLSAGETILDIRANYGELTLGKARKVGPEGSVIAFKPDQTLNQCMAENIALNRLPWVEIRRQLVGKKNGKSNFSNAYSASGLADARQTRLAPEPVDAVSLDSLGLASCALITINAHGKELEVLEGGRTVIKQFQPILYLTGSPQNTISSWVKFLQDRNYQVFRLQAPVFQAENYRNCQINLFAEVTSLNMLALPPKGLQPPHGAIKI
jgi:FkbM family methyltransferase